MAQNELYQVVLKSTYQNQTFNNVFYYKQDSAEPEFDDASEQLALLFQEQFFIGSDFLRSTLFHSFVTYESLKVVNIFDVTDYHEQLLEGYTGTGSVTPLPPYVSLGFRTSWLGPAVHRGYKRFSGLTEDANTNGTLSAGFVSEAVAFADILASPVGGGGALWSPIVIKRIPYITPSGKQGYKLPENPSQAVGKIFAADAWQLVNNLGTQNTRKFGVGV